MDNHMDNNPNGNRPDNNKGPGRQDPNKNHQSILAFLVCLLVTLVCFAMFTNMLKDNSSEITYDKFIEMVDKDQVSPEVFEMLQMMNKTSEEIFLLLDNLLKWAKNRLKKQNVYKQETDINSLVSSTAEIYIPMATQKGLTIQLQDMDKELSGFVDIDMIKTVVRNLISNAIKFSFEGGTITIGSKIEGDHVVISVKDSGKGIKKEDQEKLLKQNTHFTSYGTNNEKGSGLGLMLCKDFVEQHDGKLWFESEEGKGSTFFASLKALSKE